MKRRKNDFALGLAAIVFLGLFIVTFIFLYGRLPGQGRVVTIQFRHEDGMAPLKVGSAVMLAGSVEVGRVRDVRIEEVPDTQQRTNGPRTIFVVEAEIDQEVPLYGNCRITTNQPAVGGSGYVSIVNVGIPDVQLVEPIEGMPPQSLAAAIGTLSRELLAEGGFVDQLNKAVDPEAEGSLLHKVLVSLDDVNEMTRELRTQTDPEQQQTLLHKIHLVLDNFNATTAALRAELARDGQPTLLTKVHAALDRLGDGLAEAAAMLQENRPVIRDTLASVEHTARTVDADMIAVLRAELDPANPNSMLGKVHVAMDRTNASLANLRTMTSEGERMVVLSQPALERTLGHLQATAEHLEQASLEVLLNPSKLLIAPARQREDRLLVFQAARSFAEAARQLDNATGRLEAVLKTLPATGETADTDAEEMRSIHDAIRAAFERFQRAEETLWQEMK